jgi:hypothetical protein
VYLLCFALLLDMSTDDSDEFDIRLWLSELNLSGPGIKKVESNQITDRACILQLTLLDVSHIKLGVGDRRRLLGGIDALRKTVSTSPLEEPSPQENTSPGAKDSSRIPLVVTAEASGEAGVNANSVSGDTNGPPAGGPEEVRTSYSIEEVSNFLAGSALPANLQASVARVQSPRPVGGNQAVQNAVQNATCTLESVRPPFLTPHFPPLSQVNNHQQSPYPGSYSQQYQLYGHQQQQAAYGGYPPWSSPRLPYGQQQQFQSPQLYGNTTVPVYSPQRPSFVPSRLSSTSRDPALQQYTDSYHTASLHDLLSINEHCPSFARTGDSLYLPCNFVSHVRGSSRSEDEELLTTVSGSKLYLSNSASRKIVPEKLSYGLFFGANARILARLIPNLTPDLAAYLDYLRKLGDLMVNYTTSSVFLLDHVHRYEVVEEGKSWNYIDPSLSLNVLKKRDVNVNPQTQTSSYNQRSNTVSRIGGVTNNNNSRQQQRSTTVICWLYNQQEGCSYGAGCRFLHICNIVACGLDHPAYRHIFRGQTAGQQSAGGQHVPAVKQK